MFQTDKDLSRPLEISLDPFTDMAILLTEVELLLSVITI